MKFTIDGSGHRSLLPVSAGCWAVSILLVHGAMAAPTRQSSPDLCCVKWALAQVETGATQEGLCAADRTRGKHREVSRYQVLPELWHERTSSKEYANPALAWMVAQAILIERVAWFRARTHRDPSTFEMYVIWNAPNHYRAVGFQPRRVWRTIADRASRFANLVEDANRHRLRMVTFHTQARMAMPAFSMAATLNSTKPL
jgi:hypothetical protein